MTDRSRTLSPARSAAPVSGAAPLSPAQGQAAPGHGIVGASPAAPSLQSGYWIVDPGVAKQSQDWISAGPVSRRASPPRSSWWPAGMAAGLGVVTYVLAALVAWGAQPRPAAPAALLAGQPLVTGLLAAAVLFTLVAAWRLVRRSAERVRRDRDGSRRAGGRQQAGADTRWRPDVTVFDRTMTYTEAVELAEQGRPAAADETSDGLVASTGVPEDDLQLTDEEAALRQAWEGEIPIDPPITWPDRPVVVAIGDGVSSAARSSEISRLATRTAWYRTYYHLHALSTGTPPAAAKPWATIPPGWPASGPERDQLLLRALSRAFADANTAVVMAGKTHRRQNPTEVRPTATTLSLLALDGARYFLVHIGDCSVYHVHGGSGEVEPRQTEHNRAAAYAQLEPGHYAARYAEARRRGLQNVLTRWIGMTTDWAALDPQVLPSPGELAPGDALVLCSDGLDKHVAQDGIGRAVVPLDAEPAARRLVGWANDRGGSDHIAVAVLHTRRPGRRAPFAARWALWREDAAVAWQRYRGGTIGLALAGAGVAALVAAVLYLAAGAGLLRPPAPAPTASVPPAPTSAVSAVPGQPGAPGAAPVSQIAATVAPTAVSAPATAVVAQTPSAAGPATAIVEQSAPVADGAADSEAAPPEAGDAQ